MAELNELKSVLDAIMTKMAVLETKNAAAEHKETRDLVEATHDHLLAVEESIKQHVTSLLHTPKKAAWIAFLIGAITGVLGTVFLTSLRHAIGG